MTETSVAPIAYRRSTPSRRVRTGVITTPPPSPVKAPRKPASADTAHTRSENSTVFKLGSRLASWEGRTVPEMISVIIPTLNEEAVIEQTVRAAAAAVGTGEIIVADGGSSDRTVAFAQ